MLGLAAAGVGLAGLAGPAELLSPTSALTLCVVCAAAGTAAAYSASLAWPGSPMCSLTKRFLAFPGHAVGSELVHASNFVLHDM